MSPSTWLGLEAPASRTASSDSICRHATEIKTLLIVVKPRQDLHELRTPLLCFVNQRIEKPVIHCKSLKIIPSAIRLFRLKCRSTIRLPSSCGKTRTLTLRSERCSLGRSNVSPPELGPGQLVDMLSAAESQLQEAKASK